MTTRPIWMDLNVACEKLNNAGYKTAWVGGWLYVYDKTNGLKELRIETLEQAIKFLNKI